MKSVQRPSYQIYPLARRLRLNSRISESPRPRYFTHNRRCLLVTSPGIPRPQLPFLHTPSQRITQQSQSARYLSTEAKEQFKQHVKLGVRWSIYGWAMFACLLVVQFGIEHEVMERKYPSPSEWSFWSRIHFRNARAEEDPENVPNRIIDWARASAAYERVLKALENFDGQGKGLAEQETGGILVKGVGEMGFDASAMSKNWRTGYWEVLMGCGRCAQHLDGWVKDTTRGIAFPAEHMIGPSNPNPRPVGPNSYPAPLEENCVQAFYAPEKFYMKIITTKGFTTSQRMQAALAYADWLDFKGLSGSAEETYRWAIDIATSAVPSSESIIDCKTGILQASAPMVTQNILQAATSLATHFAQHTNISSALAIYLSVLRARRSSPHSTESHQSQSPPIGNLDTVLSILRTPKYPSIPSSGDEPFVRDRTSLCEDAILMTYIGEVLFTSSPSERETGIRWTRDAVTLAEEVAHDSSMDMVARKRCSDCANVGLTNWISMIRAVNREEKHRSLLPTKSSWTSWIGLGPGGPSLSPDWDEEERKVESKLGAYRERALQSQYGAGIFLGPGFGNGLR